jgi:hypothetical protein
MPMRSFATCLPGLLGVALAACSGNITEDGFTGGTGPGGNPPGSDPGPGTGPDNGNPGSDLQTPPGCMVPASWGDLGDLGRGDALLIDDMGQQAHVLRAPLNTTVKLVVGLWQGYAPFAQAAATPGTYPIDGANTDPDNCGVCVGLTIGADGTDGTYVARSGTVTIDELGGAGGRLTGSVRDVVLIERVQTGPNTPPSEGSCQSAITNAQFAVTVSAAPPS